MKHKWILLFVLALLVAGFGIAVVQETYSEPQDEITGSSIAGCPLMLDGFSATSGLNSPLLGDNGGDPGPRFVVIPEKDFIYGQWWDANAEITITVGGSEYHTDSNEWGYFYLRGGDFSVAAGDDVTVDDGVTTKEHTVTDLVLTDVIDNTVSGTAEANSELIVFVTDWFEYIELDVDAAGNGDWSVCFMDEADYQFHEGTFVGAVQEDEDGDATYAYRPPEPYFNVYPRYGVVHGMYWSFKDTINITILDEDKKEVASLEASSSEWGIFDTWHQVEEIKPGYTVEVADSTPTEKDHVVTTMQITAYNLVDETVSGTADDALAVYVRAQDDQGNSDWLEVSAVNGSWEADFSGKNVNISGGTYIEAWQADDERDTTGDEIFIEYPFVFVDPEYNTIWGHRWMCGAQITITVDGTGYTTTAGDPEDIPWPEPECGDIFFYDEDVNIEPGMLIEVNDGETFYEHTVKYLVVTDIDPGSDTVSGTAEAGTWVDVEIFLEEGEFFPRRYVKAEGGTWVADFSKPCKNLEGPEFEKTHNIVMGTHGAADQWDDDYYFATRIHWYAEQSFADVSPGMQFFPYIEAIYAEGITTGYGDGTYRPDDPVNRGQMAAFIARALDLPEAGDPDNPSFTDVSPGMQFFSYIEEIYAEEITTGYGDGTYRPNQVVTRGQMAAFIARALELPDAGDPDNPSFTDVNPNMQFFGYIEAIYAEGITTGYDDDTYRPNDPVNRGQMAAFLSRALGLH